MSLNFFLIETEENSGSVDEKVAIENGNSFAYDYQVFFPCDDNVDKANCLFFIEVGEVKYRNCEYIDIKKFIINFFYNFQRDICLETNEDKLDLIKDLSLNKNFIWLRNKISIVELISPFTKGFNADNEFVFEKIDLLDFLKLFVFEESFLKKDNFIKLSIRDPGMEVPTNHIDISLYYLKPIDKNLNDKYKRIQYLIEQRIKKNPGSYVFFYQNTSTKLSEDFKNKKREIENLNSSNKYPLSFERTLELYNLYLNIKKTEKYNLNITMFPLIKIPYDKLDEYNARVRPSNWQISSHKYKMLKKQMKKEQEQNDSVKTLGFVFFILIVLFIFKMLF